MSEGSPGDSAEGPVTDEPVTEGPVIPRAPSWAPRVVAEFLVIVIGVLVALGVEGLRERAEERRILNESLGDIAVELAVNEYTFVNIGERQFPQKVAGLDEVIRVLEGGEVVDTADFFRHFAESAGVAILWPVADRWEALKASGLLRLVRDRSIVREAGDFYSSMTFLREMADRYDTEYPGRALQLLPIELADAQAPLVGFARRDDVLDPTLDFGTPDLRAALLEIRSQAPALLRLARQEMHATVGRWHTTQRIVAERKDLVEALAEWIPPEVAERASEILEDREHFPGLDYVSPRVNTMPGG